MTDEVNALRAFSGLGAPSLARPSTVATILSLSLPTLQPHDEAPPPLYASSLAKGCSACDVSNQPSLAASSASPRRSLATALHQDAPPAMDLAPRLSLQLAPHYPTLLLLPSSPSPTSWILPSRCRAQSSLIRPWPATLRVMARCPIPLLSLTILMVRLLSRT